MATKERKIYEINKKGETNRVKEKIRKGEVCYDMLLTMLHNRSVELDHCIWDSIGEYVHRIQARSEIDNCTVDRYLWDFLIKRDTMYNNCIGFAGRFKALEEYCKRYSGPDEEEWRKLAIITSWRAEDVLYVAELIKDNDIDSIIREFDFML